MKQKLTVKEIIACKGKRKLAEVYVHNSLEARACQDAEIDMIVSSENNDILNIREAAKDTFFTVGLKYGKYLSEYEILKRSFFLYENGADAIYCPQGIKFVSAIASEGIPVVGHTGFIPYKSTFFGGFRAYGKTANEAEKIYRETLELQEVGAFAAEIEIVPVKVAQFIAENVEIFMIGMGSGRGCDAQYLFSEDILGYNTGHIPRHAKVYENLSEDFEIIRNKSAKAYQKFKTEISNQVYPSEKHDVQIMDSEFAEFMKGKK